MRQRVNPKFNIRLVETAQNRHNTPLTALLEQIAFYRGGHDKRFRLGFPTKHRYAFG